jgi:hypothetical protein
LGARSLSVLLVAVICAAAMKKETVFGLSSNCSSIDSVSALPEMIGVVTTNSLEYTTAKSTGKRSAFAVDVTPDRMRFGHCAVLGCNQPFDHAHLVLTAETPHSARR